MQQDMGPVKDNVALTSLKEQQSPKKEVHNSLKEEVHKNKGKKKTIDLICCL